MKTRIISALIALPMVLIPIYLGGIFMYAVVFIAVLIGLFEFNKAFKVKSSAVYGIQILSTLLLLSAFWFKQEDLYFGAIVILMMLLFIFYVIVYPRLALTDIFYGMIGFYYIVVMISHIILVREIPTYGYLMVWMILIISFGSDSCAYFFGVLFGKHPLSKDLSPKKTIEGAVGGVVGAGVLSVIYALYMANTRNFIEFELIHYIGFGLMGLVGSIFSQFGDISASAMKRTTKIKDFGKFMPGHGGIIDRMDSIIFVAPFVYYALLLILKGI